MVISSTSTATDATTKSLSSTFASRYVRTSLPRHASSFFFFFFYYFLLLFLRSIWKWDWLCCKYLQQVLDRQTKSYIYKSFVCNHITMRRSDIIMLLEYIIYFGSIANLSFWLSWFLDILLEVGMIRDLVFKSQITSDLKWNIPR